MEPGRRAQPGRGEVPELRTVQGCAWLGEHRHDRLPGEAGWLATARTAAAPGPPPPGPAPRRDGATGGRGGPPGGERGRRLRRRADGRGTGDAAPGDGRVAAAPRRGEPPAPRGAA